MIRKVLVAVDGSENSNRALDFGLDLAEKFGAAVTVLNVSESPMMGAVPMELTTVSGESMVVFAKDLRKFHEEILNKAVVHAKTVKASVEVFGSMLRVIPLWRLLLWLGMAVLMLLWLGIGVWGG